MSAIYKTSRAIVQNDAASRVIRVIDYGNPEVSLQKLLREYLLEIGFSSQYPNFGSVRIGTVHPFAVLLFQEVMGNKLNTNVFPSVTVVDSQENEIASEIGRSQEQFMMSAADIARIQGGIDAQTIFISDNALQRLESAVANGGKVRADKYIIRNRHNFDFNIWADNKEITSLLFDIVMQFLAAKAGDLHNEGFDIIGEINGRRSGDINVEFGRLLYGANVSVPFGIARVSMAVYLPYDTEIDKVDVRTQPTYHVPS